VVAPKKLIWRSISGVVDITIWLLIFHSLDFRSINTYLALGGMLVWSVVSEIGVHFFVNDKDDKILVSTDEYKKIRKFMAQINKL
jgi:Na+/H+ antiporter NhaA